MIAKTTIAILAVFLLFGGADILVCRRGTFLSPDIAVASTQMSGQTMGCQWSLKFHHAPDPQTLDTLQRDIQSLLDHLDHQMSLYKPDSDVSAFNTQTTTHWFPVSPDLAQVVQLANDISNQTKGAFDITVAPLVNLWGFGPHPHAPSIPSQSEIDLLLPHTGSHLLQSRLHPPSLRKLDPQIQIDLGAIAKGYAVDRIAELLASRGHSDYLISLAGELRASGSWRVGIETPTPDTRRILHSFTLTNSSLSTSGDYRQFFDSDGTRFCHEIDPRTGHSPTHNLASVSTLLPASKNSSARADALATALFILGPTEGPRWCNDQNTSAFFITRAHDHFDLHTTPDLPSQ